MAAIKEFLTNKDLSDSLLMGYYGGGNYGDELLLETLMNILSQQRAKNVTIFYKNPADYQMLHRDFGFRLVSRNRPIKIMQAIMSGKRIIIGGGGLWGRDVNRNILLFSLLLFLSRFILRKSVDLIGVGYYHSTSRMGHMSAWFAAKAANTIIARDKESYELFLRYKKGTSFDKDIAFLLPDISLKPYHNEIRSLQKELALPKNESFIFVALRRYGRGGVTQFDKDVRRLIADNPQVTFVVALLELPEDFPQGDALLAEITTRYSNTKRINTMVNPMALFGFFVANKSRMALIAPQFHAILSAHLAGIPFLPISYDNKVKELFRSIGAKPINVTNVKLDDLQHFIRTHAQKGRA